MEAYFDFLEVDLPNSKEGIIVGTNCELNEQGEWFCYNIMEEDDLISAEDDELSDMNRQLSDINGVLTHGYDENTYITYEVEDVGYGEGIELVRSVDVNDGILLKVGGNVFDEILQGNGIIDLGDDGIWNVFDLELFGFDVADDGDMVYYFESLGDTSSRDEIPFQQVLISVVVLILAFVVFIPILNRITKLGRCWRRPRFMVDQRKPLLNVGVDTFETIRNGDSFQKHECVLEDGSDVLHTTGVAKSIEEGIKHEEPHIVFI